MQEDLAHESYWLYLWIFAKRSIRNMSDGYHGEWSGGVSRVIMQPLVINLFAKIHKYIIYSFRWGIKFNHCCNNYLPHPMWLIGPKNSTLPVTTAILLHGMRGQRPNIFLQSKELYCEGLLLIRLMLKLWGSVVQNYIPAQTPKTMARVGMGTSGCN